MALISKIKDVKPNYFIHHFKRYYFQISANRFINQTTSQTFPNNNSYYYSPLTNSPKFRPNFQPCDEFFSSRVRFFAAPVQIKKKEEVSSPSRHRINEEITVDTIRLVNDDGHTIISKNEALNRAKHLKLDLVEVDRMSKPPVCKIMDYHREKYKKQVKEKERAKLKSAGSLKRGDCKEVRFSAKTELKDLKMKADSVKRLIERGYRVKCSATGSEDQDLTGLLSRLSVLIEDVAFVESGPTMGRDQAYLIVRHIKFGPSKKGGKKSSKNKTAASPEIQNAATATIDSAADLGGESEYEEPFLDSDDDVVVSWEGQQESAWSVTSVSSTDQKFNKFFDVGHDKSGTISSQDTQRFDRNAATSTANVNASRLDPPLPANLTGTNATPVTRVSQGTENRYAKSAAKNTSAARNPMRFPNNGTMPQPQPSPPLRGPRLRGGGEGPPPRNSRLPPDQISQPWAENQSRSSQPNGNLSGSTGQVQPPRNVGNLKTHSPVFGTFSSMKIDVNNSNGAKPSDVTSTPGPGKNPGSLNPSPSKGDGPQNSEAGEKKFGIFSK